MKQSFGSVDILKRPPTNVPTIARIVIVDGIVFVCVYCFLCRQRDSINRSWHFHFLKRGFLAYKNYSNLALRQPFVSLNFDHTIPNKIDKDIALLLKYLVDFVLANYLNLYLYCFRKVVVPAQAMGFIKEWMSEMFSQDFDVFSASDIFGQNHINFSLYSTDIV